MKLQKAEELMSLLALISVLMLVMTIVLTSPSCPWPLTVSRVEPMQQDTTVQKPMQDTGRTQQSVNDAPQTEPRQTAPASDQFPMDINRAGKQDLMEVEGIGEVKAQSILDYREQVGRIEQMEQLLEVEGIGEVTLERLCELFYVV